MSSNSSPYSSSINSLTGVTKNFSESNGLVMNFAFTILVIIVFLILFQSCFSYKTVDYNTIAAEKNQKFEVLGVGGKTIKGRLVF